MVKNALQAQLLKAGLVDNKKAKKLSKQAQHEQRTGQNDDAIIKANIDRAKQEKLAKDQDSYAYLPKALAEKIEQKMTGFILLNQQSEQNTQMTDEEDPYAAYVIPDDLMW